MGLKFFKKSVRKESCFGLFFIPPFLLGCIALSFQIFLLREFSAHFYGNEITFGLVLAFWLFWGGLGSLSGSRIQFNPSRFSLAYYSVLGLFPLFLVLLRFSRFFLKTLPGEMTGMIPTLAASLIITFFIGFPLGVLFVFNTHFVRGDLSHVYLMESLGAALSGVAVYFIFIPVFSNWEATALLGLFFASVVFFSFGRRRQKHLFFAVFTAFAALFFMDIPSQKLFWKPYHFEASKDTPYGKIQVIKTEEQISLYQNTLHVFSYPDLASSEEAVHFALLQKPKAKKVLQIGGGTGGSLTQLLKYPNTEVDYVELDPDLIRLSLHYLPKEEKTVFQSDRVSVFYRDGRLFLSRTQKLYDVILLNLPDPTTAQINRFYTEEFFRLVHKKLEKNGIFSFRVSSAENYISKELQNFLSCLYTTLKEVFPEVRVVPGSTNIFLASSHLAPLDFLKISHKIDELNLQNRYVTPQLLFARLDPLRVNMLEEHISRKSKTVNTDFKPISYFTNAVLWSTHFKGLEKKFFSFLSRVSPFWLLDFPLLLVLLAFIIMATKRKKAFYLMTPLAVMGLTTLVSEILVIISFQTLYGYIYNSIALLFASFMTGLYTGAQYRKNKEKRYSRIILIQAKFVILLAVFLMLIHRNPPEIFCFLYLWALGFLSGDLFVVSNALFLKEKTHYGLGYGLDLLGAFAGALTASSILIPLVGIPVLLRYLILLNSFCFLFLLIGYRQKKNFLSLIS